MQLNRAGDWVRPEMPLSVIANMMLPKLYAISAMWTLNSREDIRTAIENGPAMHTVHLGTTVGSPETGDETMTSITFAQNEKLQSDISKVELV